MGVHDYVSAFMLHLLLLIFLPNGTVGLLFDSASDIMRNIPDDMFTKLFAGISVVHSQNMEQEVHCNAGTYIIGFRVKTVSILGESLNPPRVTGIELMCSDFFFGNISKKEINLSSQGEWQEWDACDGGYEIGLSVQLYSSFDSMEFGISYPYVYRIKHYCSSRKIDAVGLLKAEKGDLLAHQFKTGQAHLVAQVCFPGEAVSGLRVKMTGVLAFNKSEKMIKLYKMMEICGISLCLYVVWQKRKGSFPNLLPSVPEYKIQLEIVLLLLHGTS